MRRRPSIKPHGKMPRNRKQLPKPTPKDGVAKQTPNLKGSAFPSNIQKNDGKTISIKTKHNSL
jgi:hypothetical protein